MEQNNNKMN